VKTTDETKERDASSGTEKEAKDNKEAKEAKESKTKENTTLDNTLSDESKEMYSTEED
jgi:hypothetical protein